VCALAIAGLIIWHGLSRWRSGEARSLAGWIAPIVLISILAAAFLLSGALYSDRLAATVLDENPRIGKPSKSRPGSGTGRAGLNTSTP